MTINILVSCEGLHSVPKYILGFQKFHLLSPYPHVSSQFEIINICDQNQPQRHTGVNKDFIPLLKLAKNLKTTKVILIKVQNILDTLVFLGRVLMLNPYSLLLSKHFILFI